MENKKVLMLCPFFFGYEKRFEKTLIDEGALVDLYDERPNCKFFTKACIRFGVGFYKPVVRKYIKSIISKSEGKDYDYIFVVKGEAIGQKELSLLKEAYPNAKCVLYLWDSAANIVDCEKKVPLYDRALTFDPGDAEKFKIPFLPIPYDDNLVGIENAENFKYDAAFIGTVHSARPRIVKEIEKQLAESNKNCFTYFFSPHPIVFLLNKLKNPDFKYIKWSEVNFKSLESKTVNEIYKDSRCVIDIEHPKQHGTTTRPVEMLPLGKKIITTNQSVLEFPFYSPNNFLVIDRKNPKIDQDFFKTEYVPVDEETLKKYSPREFVKECLMI